MAIKIVDSFNDDLFYIKVEPEATFKSKHTRRHFMFVALVTMFLFASFVSANSLLQQRVALQTFAANNQARAVGASAELITETYSSQVIGFLPSWKLGENIALPDKKLDQLI